MHEMHLVKDLFSDLLKHAKSNNAKKITKIFLRMGEFTEINEDIIKFFIKEKAKGTILEEAEILIEKSPNRELSLVSFDCD